MNKFWFGRKLWRRSIINLESHLLQPTLLSDSAIFLKTLIAQTNGLINSLNDLHKVNETESLFEDFNYRSDYSIDNVEFIDEYERDLDGSTTHERRMSSIILSFYLRLYINC
jgi:hypothetical protein